jgi:tRNA(Ile)-lysidine synthase
MLQQYSPRIERHLHHTATILAADYAQLRDAFAARWPQLRSGAGAGWQQLFREAFGAASVSEQRMALRTAVHTLRPGVEISFRAVEVARHHALEAHAGGSGDLPGALRYRIGYRHIWIAAKDATFPVDAPQTAGEMPLSVPGEQSLGQGWWLRATLCSPPTDITEKKSPWEVFVALRPETPLFVRGRKPGERMQPLGMKGQHAALKKIMINRKIDRELRPSWPLVTTTEHPVWLVGHLLDERARVRGNERQVVHLRCHQPESEEG